MHERSSKRIIILNSPEEIYSSFDDRPYIERDLSRNLIEELMKKAEGAGGILEIEFRVRGSEHREIREVAKRRLAKYFADETEKVKKERWLNRFLGTAFVVLGGVIISAQKRFFSGDGILSLFFVLACWLTIFLGLEYIVADWKLRLKHEILKKLKNASYSFSKI